MRDSRTPLEALNAAIEALGSQSAMARLLEVSQPTVSDWVNRMGQMPADDGKVLKVEAATGISRHELRPDIYPREDGPHAPPAASSGVECAAGGVPHGSAARDACAQVGAADSARKDALMGVRS